MSYVVYHKESTRYLRVAARSWGCYVERYASEAAAKAALTRAVKKGLVKNRDEYDIAEEGYFHKNIEKWVEKHNLLSGKPFKEPVNTPYYCSPSSETYWSS